MLYVSELFITILLIIAVIITLGSYTAYFLGSTQSFQKQSINTQLINISTSHFLHGFICATWFFIILFELFYQIKVQTLF